MESCGGHLVPALIVSLSSHKSKLSKGREITFGYTTDRVAVFVARFECAEGDGEGAQAI